MRTGLLLPGLKDYSLLSSPETLLQQPKTAIRDKLGISNYHKEDCDGVMQSCQHPPYQQARRQGGCRGVHVHPPFFSLIIACHFTEVLNCMSNRLRLHAILSISLTKSHLVQLINITPQPISSCDQYMHNYYSS